MITNFHGILTHHSGNYSTYEANLSLKPNKSFTVMIVKTQTQTHEQVNCQHTKTSYLSLE